LLVSTQPISEEAVVFHRQIAFPVEVDRLWEVLTDPDSMATWFGSTMEWELVPGGEIRVADEEGSRIGRVESVAAPHQLCFQWWPEHDDADISEVTYHLEPADEGTRLTITEERLEGGRQAPIPQPEGAVRAGSEPFTNCATPAAGGCGSAAWTGWDNRLAGVWCMTAAVPVAVAR
jgi:uncharacterized protein YndB with AHSA1/START domain